MMFTLFESPKQVFPQAHLDIVTQIVQLTGVPVDSSVRVSRADLQLADDHCIHIDIGGEGLNEHMGYISGFPNSINLNAMTYQSNGHNIPIPNLVQLDSWFKNPSYPFADDFADYITIQNAPLTEKNVTEIARCLRPGGVVELWIDDAFLKKMHQLAELLQSRVELDSLDQFGGTTGSKKFKIISNIPLDLENKVVRIPIPQTDALAKITTETQVIREYFARTFFSRLNRKSITYPETLSYESSPTTMSLTE